MISGLFGPVPMMVLTVFAWGPSSRVATTDSLIRTGRRSPVSPSPVQTRSPHPLRYFCEKIDFGRVVFSGRRSRLLQTVADSETKACEIRAHRHSIDPGTHSQPDTARGLGREPANPLLPIGQSRHIEAEPAPSSKGAGHYLPIRRWLTMNSLGKRAGGTARALASEVEDFSQPADLAVCRPHSANQGGSSCTTNQGRRQAVSKDADLPVRRRQFRPRSVRR